jgi:hypothetical protein
MTKLEEGGINEIKGVNTPSIDSPAPGPGSVIRVFIERCGGNVRFDPRWHAVRALRFGYQL